MAYQSYYNNQSSFNEDDTKLAWDLRLFYARFASKYVLGFITAEDNNDYPLMFKMLDRWYYSIKQEWCDDGEEDKRYFDLRDALIKNAVKWRNVYFGKDSSSEGVEEIEFAIQQMKQYLIFKMKKANMFGSEWNDDGL